MESARCMAVEAEGTVAADEHRCRGAVSVSKRHTDVRVVDYGVRSAPLAFMNEVVCGSNEKLGYCASEFDASSTS